MKWRTEAALLLAFLPGIASAENLPAGYVRLSEFAPGIAQDIRYARSYNFTEGPVPGYERGECILTSHTAAALLRVEERLASNGYGLVVFDCYRPVRAVEFFAFWANQPENDTQKPKDAEVAGDTPPDQPSAAQIFFPGLSRADLIPQGYIAKNSGHSVGHTVDVGLRLAGFEPIFFEFDFAAPCTADPQIRGLETGLDLGTAFDCFSPMSASTAPVSSEARKNRKILADAMNAEGFSGYNAEWWHFRNHLDPAVMPQNFSVK